MLRSTDLHASLLAVTFALVLLAPARAQQPQTPPTGFADPVLGRWDITVEGADAPYPSWVEIRLRKETELMGSFVGRSGSARHLTRIEYRDGTLSFTVPVQYEKNPKPLTFTGRLEGETLRGSTEDATGRSLTWTAVRAPLLIRDRAPAWGTPIELFNGQDLSGWTLRSAGKGNCWSVVDGSLTNGKDCVDIITERTFGDFKLHVEFSYPPKSNSGIYLRGRHEVQINDDAGRAPDSLRAGGVYGFLRPYANAAGEPGNWQTYDITLVGRRVTVVLNGQTIIANEVIPGITGGALDSREGEPGPIMLQGDHDKVLFRKVTLTPAQ